MLPDTSLIPEVGTAEPKKSLDLRSNGVGIDAELHLEMGQEMEDDGAFLSNGLGGAAPCCRSDAA